MNDVPVPRLDFSNQVDVTFHDDVASRMVILRKLHAKTASTPDRRMTQHQARIDAARHQIEDLFLARWGLSATAVAALRL